MPTAQQPTIAALRQEQAARARRINHGLTAAQAILPTLSTTDYIPKTAFIERMQAYNGTDPLTTQEILTHLDINTHEIEESLLNQYTPDGAHLGLRRHTQAEKEAKDAKLLQAYGAPTPSTQHDLFNTEPDFINKHACACCGYFTMDQPPNGSYDICPICFWEDDRLQVTDPNLWGGANVPSLNRARLNYARYGACEARLTHAVRAAKPEEKPAYRHLLASY